MLTKRQKQIISTWTLHERNELIRSMNALATTPRTWNQVTPTCERVVTRYIKSRKMKFLDGRAFRDMCYDYIIRQGQLNTFRHCIRHDS